MAGLLTGYKTKPNRFAKPTSVELATLEKEVEAEVDQQRGCTDGMVTIDFNTEPDEKD